MENSTNQDDIEREEIIKINNHNATSLIQEMARLGYHAKYNHDNANERPVDITFVSPRTAFPTYKETADRNDR